MSAKLWHCQSIIGQRLLQAANIKCTIVSNQILIGDIAPYMGPDLREIRRISGGFCTYTMHQGVMVRVEIIRRFHQDRKAIHNPVVLNKYHPDLAYAVTFALGSFKIKCCKGVERAHASACKNDKIY